MDNGFEDFLRSYVIRDGSIMKEQYAKKLISYLTRICNEENVNLDDEYKKDNFISLIAIMEDKMQNGQKNKNTFLGDRTALYKYAEFKSQK